MDFTLSSEQQMLQDTVARLARDHYSFEAREGYYHSEAGMSPVFWNQMAELGLCSVPIAQEHGGFGGSGVDNLLIMTELGRHLCLEPFLQSQIHAAGLLQQLGDASQRQTCCRGWPKAHCNWRWLWKNCKAITSCTMCRPAPGRGWLVPVRAQDLRGGRGQCGIDPGVGTNQR
jgi:hypothetical protein